MNTLAIRIVYLTGRSIASAYNDRERTEWPPHPARLYSALVQAWAEGESRGAEERAALEWLASLGAPAIHASDASLRSTVPHFVPVNDTAVLDPCGRQREQVEKLALAHEEAKTAYERALAANDLKAVKEASKALERSENALAKQRKALLDALTGDQRPFAPGKHTKAALLSAAALLPEQRGKQPRHFPSASPHEPTVFMRWEAEARSYEQHRPHLAALLGRIVRVGHSSSLVACSIAEDCPQPNWKPHDEGEEVLRIPRPDQFERLQHIYDRYGDIEPRVMPHAFQRYSRMRATRHAAPSASCFDTDWLVFRQTGGRRLSATLGVEVARAMRGALMKYSDEPIPELISGHKAPGIPSATPHLALVPLPFVGHARATGDLLGIALVLPRDAPMPERQALLRAIGGWEDARRAEEQDDLLDTPPLRLVLGRSGEIDLERIEWGVSPLKTLRSTTWCEASRVWRTATPIALDRNPGNLRSDDPATARAAYDAAGTTIADACERIGLPRPARVEIHFSVPLSGGVKARLYPPFPADPNKTRRVKVHARIEFSEPVTGPLILGAGRYYGLGLCWPATDEGARDA